MRTGKRCLIAVFFIAVYGFCAASAVAETVSSPDVILNYSLPLTGSTTTLESSNGEIKLYDLKGQPVAGVSTNDAASLLSGFGGAWIIAVWAPGEPAPLLIRRVADTPNSSIEITWEAAKYPGATIYYLTGDGSGAFTTEGWRLVADGGEFDYQPASGFLRHLAQVGGGTTEAYYRMGAGPSASPAVGKFNVNILEESNLVSIPLLPVTTEINAIVGQQLYGSAQPANADKIYYFDTATSTWIIAYLDATGQWQGMLKAMLPDQGFFIKRQTGQAAKQTTFVGDVYADGTRQMDLLTGSNLIGTVFPGPVSLESSGLAAVLTAGTPADADKVYYYSNIDKSWQIGYLSPTGFTGSLTKFEPGKGYFIKNGALLNSPDPDGWIYTRP